LDLTIHCSEVCSLKELGQAEKDHASSKNMSAMLSPLEVKTLGKFEDKFMVCLYCNFKVDIPDEFEVSRAAESKSRDGTRRRVEVSYRRRDLTPGDRDPKDKIDEIVENLVEKIIPADNEVIMTVRKGIRSKGEILEEKTFEEIADKYHRPEFSELARQVDFSMDLAKEGVEHVFEKSETIKKTAAFITIRGDTDKINSSKIILYLAGPSVSLYLSFGY